MGVLLSTAPRRRRAGLGAPPSVVSAGFPGARDEVRAYASRIADAWRDFYYKDFSPWVASFDAPSSGVGALIGDVIGGDANDRQRDLIVEVNDDYNSFLEYHEKISSFAIMGPSPSEAWQKLIQHENALKADRLEFANVSGRKLVTKDPGALELPGGVSQSSTPWTGIVIVGGLIGLAMFSQSIVKLVRG